MQTASSLIFSSAFRLIAATMTPVHQTVPTEDATAIAAEVQRQRVIIVHNPVRVTFGNCPFPEFYQSWIVAKIGANPTAYAYALPTLTYRCHHSRRGLGGPPTLYICAQSLTNFDQARGNRFFHPRLGQPGAGSVSVHCYLKAAFIKG